MTHTELKHFVQGVLSVVHTGVDTIQSGWRPLPSPPLPSPPPPQLPGPLFSQSSESASAFYFSPLEFLFVAGFLDLM